MIELTKNDIELIAGGKCLCVCSVQKLYCETGDNCVADIIEKKPKRHYVKKVEYRSDCRDFCDAKEQPPGSTPTCVYDPDVLLQRCYTKIAMEDCLNVFESLCEIIGS